MGEPLHARGPVGSPRYLIWGLAASGAAVSLILCADALEARDGRPGILEILAIGIATAAVTGATLPNLGGDRPGARWAARAAWVPFAASLLLHTDSRWVEAADLLFQAPFVVLMGRLLRSHVRPDTPLARRLNTDAVLLSALLLCGWTVHFLAGAFDVSASMGAGAAFLVGGLGAVVAGLWLFQRMPDSVRALRPGDLDPCWAEAAAHGDWTVVRSEGPRWQAFVPIGPLTATVRVDRDPVPPQTTFTVALAEVPANLGPWGATCAEHGIELTFPGSKPRNSWVGARESLPPSEVITRIVDRLEDAVRASTHS